ncbi:MAG: dUTP diphosphatase [Cyclobacteriaceae bacterium]
MEVKIVNQSGHPLPAYQTEHAAGMDVHAAIKTPITLQSLERALISTEFFIELPVGYEAQVRPRSGLAYKHGLTVLNSPGTIDADYRGEVKVLLVNLSNEAYTVQPGERIAQVVVAKHEQVVWQEVESLSETTRGAGGYGSTGHS